MLAMCRVRLVRLVRKAFLARTRRFLVRLVRREALPRSPLAPRPRERRERMQRLPIAAPRQRRSSISRFQEALSDSKAYKAASERTVRKVRLGLPVPLEVRRLSRLAPRLQVRQELMRLSSIPESLPRIA